MLCYYISEASSSLVLYKLYVSEEEEKNLNVHIGTRLSFHFLLRKQNYFFLQIRKRERQKKKTSNIILDNGDPWVSNIFYQSKRRPKGKKIFLLSKLAGKILQKLGKDKTRKQLSFIRPLHIFWLKNIIIFHHTSYLHLVCYICCRKINN